MGRLDEDTKLVARDNVFEARIPAEWRSLAPSGGFLAALALRGAGERAKVRRPVSFSCVFVAAPSMDALLTLDVTTLKTGKRSEVFRVSMTQLGRPILDAHVWTCDEGPGIVHDEAPAPHVPAPEELRTMDELPPEERHPTSPFWTNIEERRHEWSMGERPTRVQGWFAFRPQKTFDDPFVDAARPVILLDALVYGAAMGPHPRKLVLAASLDVNVHFHRSTWPLSPYVYAEVEAPIATCGRIGGTGRVWDADGRLVASGSSQMLSLAPPRERA
jgi:acyl-CoA thioesterase II